MDYLVDPAVSRQIQLVLSRRDAEGLKVSESAPSAPAEERGEVVGRVHL